ncbi:MAG TPA: protein-disulfide reductase DsbD domain-containing protein [Chitinophagaceae bacterium]|nr:protein-disulfide reductase DsbD domain-containing protein [Chitinophagaceae bacterium]
MMRKIYVCMAMLGLAFSAGAQLNPVSWSFTARKIADKTYEVHLTATIQSGWHLYSQTQPGDAIAIPTGISLNKNPLLTVEGKIREMGKLEKFHDAKLGISANQYSGKVDFVQVVKMKAQAKTNLSGSIEYQTCDDKKCLPPKTVSFSVPIS